MFGCLDYYTTLEILKYLDCDSLDKLAIAYTDIGNTYRDYIYYRHAQEIKLVDRLDYFIPDTFQVPDYNECIPLKKLMDYIANNNNLCIAGGFPTQLYMGNAPKSTSDIDIYVLCGNRHNLSGNSMFKNSELVDIEDLLVFIRDNYNDVKYLRVGPAVYSISVSEFSHPIQIIVTAYTSLAQVLSSFDNSHNRCGVYKGRSYVGIDAELSHRTKTTYFYKTAKPVRYVKALDLGFTVFGFSDSELALIGSKVVQVSLDDIENPLCIDAIISSICRNAKPSLGWKVSYADQELTENCFIPIEVDITGELSRVVKNNYSNGQLKRYSRTVSNLHPNTVIKSPNSCHLRITRPLRYNLEFTVMGTFDTSKGRWIKIENYNDIESLKVVKQNLLEIFEAYYGNIPENIKHCRSLTTWETFKQYRKDINQPLKRAGNNWTNVWSHGYEYNDSIIIYEERCEAYIKSIQHNVYMQRIPSGTAGTFTLCAIPNVYKNVGAHSWGYYDFSARLINHN
jgi:hypothetical protein